MSICWVHAGGNELLRFKSIEILLRGRPQLLHFLFDENEPRLQLTPEEILRASSGFSHGEIILITLALDIWNGSGETNLHEVIRVLDEKHWSNFLSALSVFS